MKKTFLQQGLSILLALVLVFALGACAADQDPAEGTDAAGTATATSNAATPTPTKAATATPTVAPTTAPAADTEEPAPTPTEATGPNYKGDYLAVKGSATIDGTVDESWANAEAVTLDLVKKDNPGADTQVSARMMWDENGLYFLFEIEDEEISQTGSVGDYQNDSIYLYISETLADDIGAFADFAEGTYQFALISKEKEMIPRYGESDVEWESAYTVTDTGLIIEFSYKPQNLKLEEGTDFYVDFQYNDCAGGSRSGALGWYNESDENARPELWGLGVLVPAPGAEAAE